jgi:hypothetical protein
MTPKQTKEKLIQLDQSLLKRLENPLIGVVNESVVIPILLERTNLLVQVLVYVLTELEKQDVEKSQIKIVS